VTQFNLTDREWFGRLVPKDTEEYYDPKQMGRYKVHIPSLMPHIEKEKGIWVKNQVHKWRITPSEVGEYGQYFPIQPKTYVIVKFYENDINTGYIDRIISDWKEERDVEAQDCVEKKPVLEDRDEQYILFKTPKKWNAFYVNEETKNEPNTIYLIYNRDDNPERRTVYRINEEGIHIWTRDDLRVRVLGDENTQIDGNRSRYVKGDQRQNIYGNDNTEIRKNRITDVKENEEYRVRGHEIKNIDKDFDHKTKGNVTIEVQGYVDLSVDGSVDVWSGTSINCDAPVINLNCGIAHRVPAESLEGDITSVPQQGTLDRPCSPAPIVPPIKESYLPADRIEVKDLGPCETPEYITGVGYACNDATDAYNNEEREEEYMYDDD
jgi:hypothetical protein